MSYVKVVVGTLLVVAIAVFFSLFAVQIAWGEEDQRNQVSDWCDDGMKFDDLDGASFTVPDPPEGTTWTLLVLKAGTTNSQFPFPIPGQAYFPSNEQDVSHAILCYTEVSTTTSTSTSTTTSTTTTTPSTTTTVPSTTTSSVPQATTSTTQPDSSSSTTVPPSSSTTAPPTTPTTETPVGGVPAGGGAMALQHLADDDPAPGNGLVVPGLAIALGLTLLVAAVTFAVVSIGAVWRTDG